jgi:hypothetical protein
MFCGNPSVNSKLPRRIDKWQGMTEAKNSVLSVASSCFQVSWMCRVLPCLTLITGTAVSFVAVDPSSHQLQEPQYWPTFCRNMFYAVLGSSGSRLYDHRGNWRRYSPSHIPLYIDDEWRHCRASVMVLELWQTQEERLDRNVGWIPRMVVAIFFSFGVGWFHDKGFYIFQKFMSVCFHGLYASEVHVFDHFWIT